MHTSTNTGTTGPVGRADPGLPQVFGRYLLVQRLSRGGMGEIFLAKHGLAGFEKLAVIKKVLPNLAADAQFIARFVDEAQVAIKLQHVNVAQVFEVGRVGDEYFLALEYVEGRDLRRTLAVLGQRRQRMPVDLALYVARELANGLAYAHRRTGADGASLHLVHCDISPPNVLVSFEGETKVIDFGIAKSALRGTVTDPKMGFGKFGYMAPEQLIRGGVVDHRTDLYAAGVVLFELLTGRRLYEAGPDPDYRALAKKVARGEHALPSDVDAALAPYDDLVSTALRPKAEDRYQSAAEFRDAIQHALVAVNPTISTDQLGAYMRELFASEMAAQRELHERVASAHLADFQDELTKELGTTVSFALANLPLKPADGAGPAGPQPPSPRGAHGPAGGPREPTRQTDLLEQPALAPPLPTAAIPTTALALADGTGVVEPGSLGEGDVARSRRGAVALLALAIAGVVAVIGYVALRGDRRDAPVVAEDHRAPRPQIRVESIPPEEQTPRATTGPQEDGPADEAAPPSAVASGSAAAANVDDVAPSVAPSPAPPTSPPGPAPRSGAGARAREDQGPTTAGKAAPVPAKTELTRDAVIAKFRAARREYDAYKARNGGRFDGEWNDLITFQQYNGNDLEEFARRIEAFRAKLHD